ncbi:metallopeptidase TldD-related protein [Streptomyces sp. NBC_01408]|uniref:metallopeptidase TldD-related protein n=1 Tax=Streptomyces sp. NBC_01408 TaxID=2903855 RepID=UPI00225844DE|nr:metallopeptidase TldD-related protein [Streptomyces sp. NBC_01408]MCX4692829.1 metallopeptidase TldD-related protein [Streptomyces sp. NBC_01408]
MRVLENKTAQGLATAAAVEDALHAGEHAATHLERTARRRLTADQDGRKRLFVDEGEFGGFVRLGRDGRELYLNAKELNAQGAAGLLGSGRRFFHLGSAAPAAAHGVAHHRERSADGGWETTAERLDMGAAAAGAAALSDALAARLHGGQGVGSLQISDVLRESVFADRSGTRLWDRCYGVELTAVATSADGTRAVSASRYATGLDGIDPACLGRELSLMEAGMAPGEQRFEGSRVVFAPSAAAQLLRALTQTVLFNPITSPVALAAALVDEGPRPDAYGARSFDCEGSPTGRTELIGVDGVQRAVATRKAHVGGAPDEAGGSGRLTGHAWWNPLKNFPQPTASNIRLTPTGAGSDLLAGERCVVVDARTLGVEEFRSGGQLAFRLLAARAVDGVPQGSLRPMSVEGGAIDFLASVTAVGDHVSYFPGPIPAGGGYMEMDLTRVTSKERER